MQKFWADSDCWGKINDENFSKNLLYIDHPNDPKMQNFSKLLGSLDKAKC